MVRMAVTTDRATAMDAFTTRDIYIGDLAEKSAGLFIRNRRKIVRLEHRCPNGLYLPEEWRDDPVNRVQRKNAENAAIIRRYR